MWQKRSDPRWGLLPHHHLVYLLPHHHLDLGPTPLQALHPQPTPRNLPASPKWQPQPHCVPLPPSPGHLAVLTRWHVGPGAVCGHVGRHKPWLRWWLVWGGPKFRRGDGNTLGLSHDWGNAICKETQRQQPGQEVVEMVGLAERSGG